MRLEILFAPITSETLPRAAQLTQRTNQMNASLVRYSEDELDDALTSDQKDAFTVTVSDRFGSYGLVGLVLFSDENDALQIDNFLLSCRALGRGVEHKMLTHAAEIARERSKPTVKVHVRRGPRNQPALQFLGVVCPAPLSQSEEFSLECPTALLINLAFPGSARLRRRCASAGVRFAIAGQTAPAASLSAHRRIAFHRGANNSCRFSRPPRSRALAAQSGGAT